MKELKVKKTKVEVLIEKCLKNKLGKTITYDLICNLINSSSSSCGHFHKIINEFRSELKKIGYTLTNIKRVGYSISKTPPSIKSAPSSKAVTKPIQNKPTSVKSPMSKRLYPELPTLVKKTIQKKK